MRTALRLLRNAALAVAALVLVLSLALAAGVVWLRSASGDDWLRHEAVGRLNGLLADSGLQLAVDGLEGPLPERLQVRGLVVSDAQGPWLQVPEAELRLDLAALLDPAVLVPSVVVRDARLIRLPVLPPSSPTPPDEPKFPADVLAWYPPWLRFVRVDDLRVERFSLPADLLGLAGEPLLVSAQGSLAVPHAEEIRSRLRVEGGRSGAPATEVLTLDAALQTGSERLRLDLRAQGNQEGLVAALLRPYLEGSPVAVPTGFTLTLSGDAPILNWTGDLSLTAVGLAGVQGRVGLALPSGNVQETSVRLDVTAEAPGLPEPWRGLGPLTLQTEARFGADSVAVPDVRLRLGTDTIRLEGQDIRVGLSETGELSGSVHLSFSRPEAFAVLLPVAGADLTLTVGGTFSAPDARLVAGLRDLRDPARTVVAEQVAMEANLTGTLAQPAARVRVQSPALAASDKHFQQLDAELGIRADSLNRERLQASSLKAELRIGLVTPHGPARLQVEAALREETFSLSKLQLSGLGLTVDGGLSMPLPTAAAETPRATGTLKAHVTDWAALSALLPVALQADRAEALLSLAPDKGQSLKLDWIVQGLDVEGLSLSTLSGRLNGHNLFAGPNLALTVELGAGTAADLHWNGARLDLSADAGKQSAQFSTALDSLTYGRVGETYPIMARLSGSLTDKKTLACLLNVSGLGLAPLEGRVNLPVRFVDGLPDIPLDGRLSGELRWQGALASVWRLVPLANTRVRGDATLDVTLGGTVAQPRPSGVIRLEKVLFQDLAQAFEVSNIMAELTLQSNGSGKAVVTGTDGKKGTFQLSGTVGPLEAGFPLDIQGSIDRLMPLQRRDVRLSLSGTARVTGTPAAPDVKADITVNRGEVLLENLPSGGIVSLDVVDAPSPTGDAPATDAQNAAMQQNAELPPIGQLHVTVTVPRRFYVRGHGIESEWKGLLRINGPFTAPAVAGDISSIRGTLSFLNKTFVLKRGSVTFDGGVPPRPMLDIQVGYTQQDFTALITLSGPATRPRLKLSSQPSLPTDEIVAQILFGKSTSNLARGEALQLAATVASLTIFGQSGGGLLDFTRSAFGLDVVRFGSGRGGQNSMAFSDSAFGAGGQSTGQGDAAQDDLTLEVGKYVLDNVYVGLEQGMESDSTGVVVDIEVTPSLSLEARTTGKGSEVGAKWSWDY